MTQAKLQPISVRKGQPAVRTGQQFCYALDPVWKKAIQALFVYWSIEFWRAVRNQWGCGRAQSRESKVEQKSMWGDKLDYSSLW